MILIEAIKNGLGFMHVNAVLSGCHHDDVSRDASYNQLFDSLIGRNWWFLNFVVHNMIKFHIS